MTTDHCSQEFYIKAYKFAAQSHLNQTVPGTELPYIMHLSFVSMEILGAVRIEPNHDQNLALQCALLHDVIEDTEVTYPQVASEFGKAVADGVLALSKDKTLEKSLQMADCLERIRQQPSEIWMVKLADRITNLQPPPAHWTPDKITRYKAEALQIWETLGAASDFLASRLLGKINAYDSQNR